MKRGYHAVAQSHLDGLPVDRGFFRTEITNFSGAEQPSAPVSRDTAVGGTDLSKYGVQSAVGDEHRHWIHQRVIVAGLGPNPMIATIMLAGAHTVRITGSMGRSEGGC
ncbi:hypothetical protein ACDY97_10800 [Rhizobium mongolense]|uniref:hypothetical protein n=1 Tax=Rhizobium mongolense TaxID=57676 RepID=UPI003557C1FF